MSLANEWSVGADTGPIDDPGADTAAITPAVSTPLMELTASDEERAEVNLLGNGYLRRGQGMLLVGPTGVGKSAFVMQGAVKFAHGEQLFGIRPQRALKVLLVQAENDDIDLVEMRDGVLAGCDLDDEQRSEVAANLHVITEHSRGKELLLRIEEAVTQLGIDLLILDPIFAYIEGAVRDQENVTYFLRSLLQPFIVKHGIGVIVVHHSNKPPSGKEKSTWQAGDFAYAGSGSMEFANWARAVMFLRSIGSFHTFELKFSKRGKRLGIVDEQGAPVFSLPVKHSTRGIFWKLVDGSAMHDPAVAREHARIFEAFDSLRKGADNGVATADLARALDVSKRTVDRHFSAADGRIQLGEDILFRRNGRIFRERQEELY